MLLQNVIFWKEIFQNLLQKEVNNMRMLDLEFDEVPKKMVTENEAREHLATGVPVVCKVTDRDCYEIRSEKEVDDLKALAKQGVYSSLKFYAD